MNWGLIVKTPNPALEGNWKNPRVKPHLRIEGGKRCVYCSIAEGKAGGVRQFHVEHFKPKSKPQFASLENSLSNLFYSCPICNTFKSDTWPGDPSLPDYETAAYVDPTVVDYATIFTVNNDGQLEGLNASAKYMIQQLFLNRTQLILERRQSALDSILEHLQEHSQELIEALKQDGSQDAIRFLTRLLDVSNRLTNLFLELQRLPLYEPEDVRRQR